MKLKSLFAVGLFALSKCHAVNNDDNFFLQENEKEISDDAHKNFVKYQPESDIEFLDDEVMKRSQSEDDDVFRKSRYGSTMFEKDDDEYFSFKLRGSDTGMRFNRG